MTHFNRKSPAVSAAHHIGEKNVTEKPIGYAGPTTRAKITALPIESQRKRSTPPSCGCTTSSGSVVNRFSNRCGLVDPDIFIARSNLLAQQLRAAKQEKERILGAEQDDTIPRTRELMEQLETMPEFLPDFDGDIFTDLVTGITAGADNTLRFRLKNGLELTETIERSAR